MNTGHLQSKWDGALTAFDQEEVKEDFSEHWVKKKKKEFSE